MAMIPASKDLVFLVAATCTIAQLWQKKAIQDMLLNRLQNLWGERWDLNPRPPRPQPGAATY